MTINFEVEVKWQRTAEFADRANAAPARESDAETQESAMIRTLPLLLAVMLVACGKSADSESEPPRAAEGQSPPASASPPASSTASTGRVVHKVGETVANDSVVWVVLDAADRGSLLPETDEKYEAKTAGRFIQVHFRFTNQGKFPTPSLDAPPLIDSKGRVFNQGGSGEDHLPGDTLRNGNVPPGIPTEYWAMYEVALDASQLQFRITHTLLVDLGLSAKQGNADNATKEASKVVAPTPADLEACKQKDATACSRACEANDPQSCLQRGELLLSNTDPSIKRQCAAPLQKACDGKLGKACWMLGQDCLFMALNEQWSSKHADLFVRSCDLGSGSGCLAAAFRYSEGEGVTADSEKAAALTARALTHLKAACDGGDGEACWLAGMQYEFGKTVAHDLKGALALYKRACKHGSEGGCLGLKRLAN